MKTKEDVIKEAWGAKLYDKAKHVINENGWFDMEYLDEVDGM